MDTQKGREGGGGEFKNHVGMKLQLRHIHC